MRFPRGVSGKESACQCRSLRRPKFDPWVGKIPWRREWQPTPVFLPGESHGQRSLVGCSPWGRKESDTAECTGTHTTAGKDRGLGNLEMFREGRGLEDVNRSWKELMGRLLVRISSRRSRLCPFWQWWEAEVGLLKTSVGCLGLLEDPEASARILSQEESQATSELSYPKWGKEIPLKWPVGT